MTDFKTQISKVIKIMDNQLKFQTYFLFFQQLIDTRSTTHWQSVLESSDMDMTANYLYYLTTSKHPKHNKILNAEFFVKNLTKRWILNFFAKPTIEFSNNLVQL